MLPHTPPVYQPFYLTIHRLVMLMPLLHVYQHRVHVDHTWHPCLVIIRRPFVTPYPHYLFDDTHAPTGLSRNTVFTYYHPSSDHRTGDYVIHFPVFLLSPESGMTPPHILHVDHPVCHTLVLVPPHYPTFPPFYTF